jgi:hypothetical protein
MGKNEGAALIAVIAPWLAIADRVELWGIDGKVVWTLCVCV